MSAERDPITDEERVLIGLVEDILQATPGLRYHLHLAGEASDEDDADDEGTYATFTIETNPAHELTVLIELARDAFRLRINGDAFSHAVENHKRLDRWMEHRCRDVEKLVSGDLKIEDGTLFGLYLSSELLAGTKDKWTEIGDRDDGWGWIGLAVWFLPFGILPVRSRKTVYRDWWRIE